MPWQEVTIMSQREEFLSLANEGCNFSRLCEGFGISRKTGYKWLKRFQQEGKEGLVNRSRRPLHSPHKTGPGMERRILHIRDQHPAWGGRKIRARLAVTGDVRVPAASTITAILKRHDRIDAEESGKHKPLRRFEASAPNDLWQMDFKGHIAVGNSRCHPLTILDDHSRYSLDIRACRDEKGTTVKKCLERVFSQYGLPHRMLVDNGSPWGSDQFHVYTPLTVWLIRLGIRVVHSRPYHPQTMGKDERFHRTLKAEILQYCKGSDFAEIQRQFDAWRFVYNQERPHESVGMGVPAGKYQISPRKYQGITVPIEYAPNDIVRKVQYGGIINFQNKEYRLPRAFRGERVALRPTIETNGYHVFYCNQKIGQIDLKTFTV